MPDTLDPAARTLLAETVTRLPVREDWYRIGFALYPEPGDPDPIPLFAALTAHISGPACDAAYTPSGDGWLVVVIQSPEHRRIDDFRAFIALLVSKA